MLANGQTVIGGENHVCVVSRSGGVQGGENAADLLIHVGGVGVILGTVELHRLLRSWKRRQQLVASAEEAVIERMLGKVIWRDLDAGTGIAVHKLARGLPGIVRRVEADIHQEGIGSL